MSREMPMRIATNLEALNSHRHLASASSRQTRAMERMSSGYRINRAADDAAGLAISESMRGKIGGLAQATRNAQDATSLLQIAEGALGEVTAMLQRVRDLAVQYHNGTLTSDDRDAIQAEARELGFEAINIADRTQFNGIPMFGRSDKTRSFQTGANDGETIAATFPSLRDCLGVRSVSYTGREYIYRPQATDSTFEVDAIHRAPDGTSTTTHHSFFVPANSTVDDLASIV